MTTTTIDARARSAGSTKMGIKAIIPFLAITFGLTWGLAALLLLFYDQIVAIFGEVNSTNPLFILAVYSPALQAYFWSCGITD